MPEKLCAATILLKLSSKSYCVPGIRNPIRLNFSALANGRVKISAFAELIAHQGAHKRCTNIYGKSG